MQRTSIATVVLVSELSVASKLVTKQWCLSSKRNFDLVVPRTSTQSSHQRFPGRHHAAQTRLLMGTRYLYGEMCSHIIL